MLTHDDMLPPLAANEPKDHALAAVISQIGDVILGKDKQIRLALTCLLARGHLLIEDVPGVGKTTLAHTLALTLGLEFQRIQFTSDLLPGDVTGTTIFKRESDEFVFHPGPVFVELVLADEINRATPKTQSALLEAMEERQVTVDGTTHRLPEPFFVVATQNPSHQAGTFPLPESQLDRFLMRLELGYPDADAERALLLGHDRRELLRELQPLMGPTRLLALQAEAAQVHLADALVAYVQDLTRYTRESGAFREGLSPRAGLALVRAAQAWAYINGRNHTLPEDVQAIIGPVVNHRLQGTDGAGDRNNVGEHLLEAVPIP